MEIEALTEDEVVLILSRDDVALINNALNEVCNGIHWDDAELRTRTGFTREEVRAALKLINRAGREMGQARVTGASRADLLSCGLTVPRVQ
ncbi:hypothetical protein [Planotetraspora sp. GP83]|uniref:hypothetical protein n=1 Tax=Planotetraspora sp. GP83 TaxID=3156264 RepID=UPI0035133C9C